ncbi:MAG: hypothetical protein CMM50_02160 [Rhodospirillaceae bacterium]|nr:hypothetical protein [Rhodospirillaceae bacterium]
MVEIGAHKQRRFLTQLRGAILDLRSQLWFRPAAFCIVAALISIAVPFAEVLVPKGWVSWFGDTHAATAQEVLKFLASGMLTIITIIMSALMLVLSVASGQASPRAVPELMADPVAQNTLGIFLATFVFSFGALIVIGADLVERRGMAIYAVATLVLVILVLRYLLEVIHHVPDILKINTMIARVHRQAEAVLQQYFAEAADDPAAAGPAPQKIAEGVPVWPKRVGYVRWVDHDLLVEAAEEHNVRIELLFRIGEFVSKAAPLMLVEGLPDDENDRDAVIDRLRSLIAIGSERSSAGDPLLGIDLLAEIASRALSPGINDVGSTITCIDYLESLLAIAGRGAPASYPPAWIGEGRVMRHPVGFAVMLRHAIRGPARDGAMKVEVALEFLSAIKKLTAISDSAYRNDLLSEARRIAGQAEQALALQSDRDRVKDALRTVKKVETGEENEGEHYR